MKYIVFICTVLLMISSCSESPKELVKQLSEYERFKLGLKEQEFPSLKLNEAEYEFLNDFYSANNYNRVWVTDSTLLAKGDTLNYLLNRSYLFSTPLNRYAKFSSFKEMKLYEVENLLTLKLAYLLNDMKSGYIDTTSKTLKPLQTIGSEDLHTFVRKIDTSSIEKEILDYYSPHEKFTQTLKAINGFVKNYNLDTVNYNISDKKEDSLYSYQQAKIALFTKGYLDTPEIEDSIFITSLQNFQRMNGIEADGILGKNTVKALNESNAHKYNRGVLALDKWRWKKDLPNKYIWVNVPAYELNFYINDSLKRKHKVVVGTNATRTPEFSANMKTIVAYPYWHVPYSISSKEILYHVKRDSTYLYRNHYKIFSGKDSIDPKLVDWKSIGVNSFPYRVRQEGGKHNSLGLVKMLFPNEHQVYIHDTPSKRFFNKAVRSFSHGCIRCQNPVELAAYILERDQNVFTRDSLDTLIERRVQKVITLNEPFPVYIDYVSVTSNEENKVVFYLDIYAKDEEWLALFEK